MSIKNAMNLVSITQAKTLLTLVIEEAFRKNDIPVNCCMHGSPGLGKSAIVAQMCKEMGERLGKPVELIDIRLSAMEASDVQGIPYTAEVNGTGKKEMFFSTPEWFPRDPDKYYVLFLDELLNCGPSVQHAAYRLILDRTIQNGTKLPDSCAVIAAGNLKEDKTGSKTLMPAAANRFGLHLLIDKNNAAQSFVEYAVNAGIHRHIIGFMLWKKASIYDMGEGEVAFATPRTWEFVDKHLKNEKLSENPDLLRIAISGAIGSAIATQFFSYLEVGARLPNWSDVRSGKLVYKFDNDCDDGFKYAVGTGLAMELLDAMKNDKDSVKNPTKEVGRLCEIAKQLPTEILTVMFKTMQVDKVTLLKHGNYPELKAQWEKVAPMVRGRGR